MADPDLERILAELLKQREELATLTWIERDAAPEQTTAPMDPPNRGPEPENELT